MVEIVTFTFSKPIKGKANPHDLQGGNWTTFKIWTLVSKSLVHEPHCRHFSILKKDTLEGMRIDTTMYYPLF